MFVVKDCFRFSGERYVRIQAHGCDCIRVANVCISFAIYKLFQARDNQKLVDSIASNKGSRHENFNLSEIKMKLIMWT